MEGFFRAIAVAFILGICGTAFRSMSSQDEYLPDNAPDGAIEFFESSDGKSSITLFEDKFVAKGDFVDTHEIVIPIRDIVTAKRNGTDFKIESRDGTYVTFSLNFFSRQAAVSFKETLDDLMKEINTGNN